MAPMLRRRPKRPLENLLSNWIRFVDVSPNTTATFQLFIRSLVKVR